MRSLVFGWPVGTPLIRDVWRYASRKSGPLFAARTGVAVIQECSVISLDIAVKVGGLGYRDGEVCEGAGTLDLIHCQPQNPQHPQ